MSNYGNSSEIQQLCQFAESDSDAWHKGKVSIVNFINIFKKLVSVLNFGRNTQLQNWIELEEG